MKAALSGLGKVQPWLVALPIAAGMFIIWQLLRVESMRPILATCPPQHNYDYAFSDAHATNWTFDVARDGRNLGLTDDHCDAAFPDLYQEIDRAKTWHKANKPRGVITEEDINQYDDRAQLRVMIYEGQAMYRAIAAMPNPHLLPNIEFTIDTHDDGRDGGPRGTIWTYCRHSDARGEANWVMPDFGFWSFPTDTVGSYNEFRSKVKLTEEEGDYSSKIDRIFWRGQEGNGGEVRRMLIQAAEDKPWSDVQWLTWGAEGSIAQMHDHCRYKYTAHTEGVTWSGRLRYLQNCNNVVITHKLDYFAHYYPLIVTSGPNQNIVEVERDYSDLQEKMESLINNPEMAQQIAARSVDVFRDRYLTPAAEACYWRRMFRTWKEIQGFEPRIWTDGRPGEEGPRRWRGVSWEQYSVTGKDWGTNAPA
ncbi:hypothetical protein FH972_022272 [Carpinus fangiana]|uniref:Glycosyl transferase CAP10 domain-containing protein n=1 Tax=Carpinus fangiana TaxID=176857 RepID=A0A5N6KSB5_9ROSI|nr:hypothetical protein FH972_022272 [Carpinus fangiana]